MKLTIVMLLACLLMGCGSGGNTPQPSGRSQVWFYTPDVEAIELRLESLGDAPERDQLEAILAGGQIGPGGKRNDLDKWYIETVTYQ